LVKPMLSLNRSLLIFFRDAVRVAITNPSQALAFIRTLNWLRRAARVRARWKRQGYLVPPIIIFSITNRCNLRCTGCYNQTFHTASGSRELSPEKLAGIAREARELGVSFFVIAGGEPLLRPELFDIIRDYRDAIFLVFTNGSLIDDPMIARLRKLRNFLPMISLDGAKTETDERRGPGAYDFIRELMAKLGRNSIFFGSSLTLTRENFDAITSNDFIKDLADSGCRFFLFIEYSPVTKETEKWVLTEEQWAAVPLLMQSLRKRFPALFIAVPWDEEDVGGCLSAGRGFVHINAEGDVEPCPFAPFSETNVREMSLKDALQSDFLKKIREREELSRETGGGCVLWKNRDVVMSLLDHPSASGTLRASCATTLTAPDEPAADSRNRSRGD
jgi:MoaA/NifB/PqqE/SkfB family radical SAM enzyme